MNIQASNRFNKIKPYAFAEINKKVAALKEAAARGEAKDPIDFGVGDPSEPTPEFVIKGLEAAGKKHACSGYPNYVGSKEYREECASYMKRRFGVEFDPETEICSSVGSKEAVFNFPEGFINPGDVVICPSPGYPPYKTGTIFAEGEPYFVPLLAENGFLVDYEAIPAEICERAKIIWINYPNSPTGAVASREYYEGLIAWANDHDIIIAADEGCYIDIYFDDKPISILEVGREGVVAFYSMSKRNNMTGYRAGFVCGDSRVVDIYKRLKTNIDSGTPSIVQEAAILALKDDTHVEKMRGIYKEKRDILEGALKSAGLVVEESSATFYVWQRVPAGVSDVQFAEMLLAPEVAIVVTPGSLISDECEGGINPGEGYVRFALMPTIEEMKEAAERLMRLMRVVRV
ncbi:MAG: aminotransferase class I/II-fold pyridoxal phosphate-dependent enzyme [Candidatus Curtissbacteria bacterium]|nr:aminotransferase class I/II-fold pyridoxal phosphate-dependent enzyme [Candidatus Curtissbacteria bacterium]